LSVVLAISDKRSLLNAEACTLNDVPRQIWLII